MWGGDTGDTIKDEKVIKEKIKMSNVEERNIRKGLKKEGEKGLKGKYYEKGERRG